MSAKPWFVPLCVAAFTLALCAVTISPASNFDGYMVWRFCQRILQGVPYDESVWDHRTARFGVVFPTLLVQAIFGTSLGAYHVVTSLTAATAAVATFLLGRSLVNTWVGLLATATVVLLPVMGWYSDCQLTAELFSMTFVPLYLLFAFRYSETGKSGDLWACSLLFGASYFAKETNLFFGPGVVWMLYRHAPRRWLTLSVFSATNIGLFLLETALYRAFTAQRLGRASVIMGNHLHNRAAIEEVLPSLWHLFRRFTELRIDMAIPVYVFFGVCVWVWLRQRRGKLWWAIVPALSFLVLTTFGIRSVNPIKLVQPFRDRYLLPTLGLECIVIWAMVDALGLLDVAKRWFASLGRRGPALVFGATVLTIGLSHVGLRLLKRYAPAEERPFREAVALALRERTPMIAPAGDRKTMLYIQSFLWSEYQPQDWQVFTLPNQREVMLPVAGLMPDEAAAAAFRSQVGSAILRTEYGYAYRAKPAVLSETDFAASRQVVDKD